MAKAKAASDDQAKAASDDQAKAPTRYFRDSRTNAVRRTAGFLGYPYVELTDEERADLEAGPQASTDDADGHPPDDA